MFRLTSGLQETAVEERNRIDHVLFGSTRRNETAIIGDGAIVFCDGVVSSQEKCASIPHEF